MTATPPAIGIGAGAGDGSIVRSLRVVDVSSPGNGRSVGALR